MTATDRFTPRNIYLYVVCLIALVIAIFAAVNLVRSTVELLYPDRGYYYGYVVEPGKTIDPAERQRQEDSALDSQRRQAVLSLVGSATTLLVAAPVYVFHWRRIERELPPRTPTGATPTQP